jgi:hypothetical protein
MTVQDVAVKTGNPVAAYDYSQYAGAGFEGSTAADFKPSFLKILHGTSPQIQTIANAKPGLVIDSVTNELFEVVNFVPAVREHVMVAWKPRGKGGGGGAGFGGVFEMDSPEVIKALENGPKKFEKGEDGKVKLPWLDSEHQLVETVYFHGVQMVDEAIFPATVPFTSTGLPGAGAWFTLMRKQIIRGTSLPKPFFAHAYILTVREVHKDGNTWYNFTPTFAGGNAKDSALAPDSEMFKAGAAVYEAFKAGKADIDYAGGGGGDTDGDSNKTVDGKVPF